MKNLFLFYRPFTNNSLLGFNFLFTEFKKMRIWRDTKDEGDLERFGRVFFGKSQIRMVTFGTVFKNAVVPR